MYLVSETFLSVVQENTRRCYWMGRIAIKMETRREQLRGQLRRLSGAKKKLTDMIDRLDVTDKHYARKYQHISFRMWMRKSV